MSAAPEQPFQIEFIDERERELFAETQLAESFRVFLASEVGSYLHGCAKQEVEICKEELLALVVPGALTPEQIQQQIGPIQVRAWCATNLLKWCDDVFQAGETAAGELQEEY